MPSSVVFGLNGTQATTIQVPDNQTFSPESLALLADAEWWPRFHHTTLLVEQQLKALQVKINASPETVPAYLPPHSGRITRGSNYRGYPYRVLDVPASIQGMDIFLFRTVVVWGHSYSFHLILSGKWKTAFPADFPAIAHLFPQWYYSLEDSPWEWLETDPGIFSCTNLLSGDHQRLQAHPFLKFSLHFPLSQLPDLPQNGFSAWKDWYLFLQAGGFSG